MKSSRLLIAGAVAVLIPFAGAVAQSPTPAQEPSSPPAQSSQQGATFESLDTNSDGKISKTEAAANESVSAQFSKYDKDGNGFIEKAEVSATNTAPSETPSKP
jgi:hypothetical protein